MPPWETISPAVVHDKTQWDFFKSEGGKRWPLEMLKKAERDVEAFVHILETEGVTVRRPERFAWDQPIAAPMAWRSRHFEHHAYKSLCVEVGAWPGAISGPILRQWTPPMTKRCSPKASGSISPT